MMTVRALTLIATITIFTTYLLPVAAANSVFPYSHDLCSSDESGSVNGGNFADRVHEEIRDTLCKEKIEDKDAAIMDVVLYFDQVADLDDVFPLASSRASKRLQVRNYLKAHADTVQSCVMDELKRSSSSSSSTGVLHFKSFWIANAIEIQSISRIGLQTLLKACPPSDTPAPYVVDKNYQRKRQVSREDSSDYNNFEKESSSSLAWNIQKIKADQVWAKGINGSGITIATLDGGVNYQHVALKYNYRGATVNGKNIDYDHDYNWNDWAYNSPYPSDNEGHGTNVAGVASGTQSSGIGVAVGSKWMAGKVFNYAGYSNDTWIIEAAQWVLCPTPVNDFSSDKERCDLGADIVSCSWGDMTAHSKASEQYINSWIKAGVLPVYAAGNSGPACSTVVAPATISGVIGVGGTDKQDEVVSWSSRGPGPSSTNYNTHTPAIVAPGLSIYGPSCDDTSSYVGFSGTSQACPHVAGVAALVLSAQPELSIDKLTNIILTNAATDTVKEPSTGEDICGGKEWNDFTNGGNYIYGSGRLDALAAVNAALAAASP
jgi:subtilisin family serine protease